nr:hypothetical protein [Clostridia bacterium]
MKIRKIRYDYIRSKVDEFIVEFGLNKLPVDPFDIIKKKKWTLRTYDFYAQMHKVSVRDVIEAYGSEDGFTIFTNGLYSIAYNNRTRSVGRIRFTLMHEIGHIYLKHLEEFKQTTLKRGGLSTEEYEILEKEAHIFASEVLSPYQVLIPLRWINYKLIQKYCGLSTKAAQIRAAQIRDLLVNNVYVDEHSVIYRYFYNFIHCKHCTYCGFSFVSKEAKYCPICGQKLQWGEGTMKYNDGYELDEKGKVLKCPICGNEEVGESEYEEYCIICGTYLINKCTSMNCERIVPGNARYCPYCGSQTTFFRDELLLPWEVAQKRILEEQQRIKEETNEEVAATIDEDELPF